MTYYQKDQAIVLNSKDYGESDKIVTLFLREEGKRNAIAKGAKRSQKRFGSCLEIGSFIEVAYSSPPKRNLLILKEASHLKRESPWRSSLKTIVIASYCLELSSRTLPEGGGAPKKFELLKEFLISLEEKAAPSLLFDFEFHWLSLSGWEPSLGICGLCGIPFKESALQGIYDHYWGHILAKPLVSRKLLDPLLL